jgi:hypothetical protein
MKHLSSNIRSTYKNQIVQLLFWIIPQVIALIKTVNTLNSDPWFVYAYPENPMNLRVPDLIAYIDNQLRGVPIVRLHNTCEFQSVNKTQWRTFTLSGSFRTVRLIPAVSQHASRAQLCNYVSVARVIVGITWDRHRRMINI